MIVRNVLTATVAASLLTLGGVAHADRLPQVPVVQKRYVSSGAAAAGQRDVSRPRSSDIVHVFPGSVNGGTTVSRTASSTRTGAAGWFRGRRSVESSEVLSPVTSETTTTVAVAKGRASSVETGVERDSLLRNVQTSKVDAEVKPRARWNPLRIVDRLRGKASQSTLKSQAAELSSKSTGLTINDSTVTSSATVGSTTETLDSRSNALGDSFGTTVTTGSSRQTVATKGGLTTLGASSDTAVSTEGVVVTNGAGTTTAADVTKTTTASRTGIVKPGTRTRTTEKKTERIQK